MLSGNSVMCRFCRPKWMQDSQKVGISTMKLGRYSINQRRSNNKFSHCTINASHATIRYCLSLIKWRRMMVPEERTIVHGTCGREHGIGSWITYMPLLTNCNLSMDHDYLMCSTGHRGWIGKSASFIGLISARWTVSAVSWGCSGESRCTVKAEL